MSPPGRPIRINVEVLRVLANGRRTCREVTDALAEAGYLGIEQASVWRLCKRHGFPLARVRSGRNIMRKPVKGRQRPADVKLVDPDGFRREQGEVLRRAKRGSINALMELYARWSLRLPLVEKRLAERQLVALERSREIHQRKREAPSDLIAGAFLQLHKKLGDKKCQLAKCSKAFDKMMGQIGAKMV